MFHVKQILEPDEENFLDQAYLYDALKSNIKEK